jgi:NADPH-dependent ferric siderophore reductase
MFAAADGTQVRRDYTPRRFDREARELTIEFALHGDGEASGWARRAAVGHQALVGGPRGSMILPLDLDWQVLMGDATALPAIARRMEELPAGSRALVFVHAEPGDRRAFASAADADVRWFDTPDALVDTLQGLALPAGRGFAWGGGEASLMARVRQVLNGKGVPREATRVSAYWKRGVAEHHEHLD